MPKCIISDLRLNDSSVTSTSQVHASYHVVTTNCRQLKDMKLGWPLMA
jgi:hypothetical protein